MVLPPIAMVQQFTFMKRISLIAGLVALAATFSTSAVQAGNASLYVEQESANATFGEWAVTFPNGGDYSSSLKTKIISNIDAGTYRFAVRPPANAYVHISLYESGVKKQETDINNLTFDIKDGTAYRITVTYTYKGVIDVLSDPSGVEFEMVSVHGDKFTGKTPATFSDMPAIGYRVTWGLEHDCIAKKSQERPLYAGSKLTFYTKIDCGDARIATSGRTAKQLATKQQPTVTAEPAQHSNPPASRIVQTSSMSEVLPGGRVRMTLAIRNLTRETLNNVRVSDRFSPEMIEIVSPILDGGAINDNQIEWNVPKIYAGKTWTTTFDFVAKDHLVPGDRIVLLAHATSDENDALLYPEAWSSVVGIAVSNLPQTGGRYDLLFAIAALLGATLITKLTIRTKQNVVLTA